MSGSETESGESASESDPPSSTSGVISNTPITLDSSRESAPPSAPPPPSRPPSSGEVSEQDVDPRLFALENPLIENDWEAISEMLGPPEHAEDLPPALGLIYATARRETGDEHSGTHANFLAIKSVAALLEVPKDSAIALVLAKRLLRGRPASNWRTAQAPPARTSTLIIILTLCVGAAVGWLLGPGGGLG